MNTRTKMCGAVGSVAVVALALTGCGTNDAGDGAEATVDIRFGHLYETTHPFHECGAQPFAEAINGSDLGLKVSIYPASQLGNEQELVQSIASGDIDIALGGPGAVANWYEPISVLDAAYVVDDWDHMKRVWDSEIGDEFRTGLEESGIVPLDLWLYGSRHLTTGDKPIHSPSDLAGLKIRAIDTPISLANATALGSSPVPVAFDELYIALSQGVVDGQENPIPTIDSLKLFEVQGYLNLTGHLLQSTVMLASTGLMEKLNDDQRAAIHDEMVAAGDRVRECVETIETDRLAEWEESGAWTEIVHPEDIDLEAFRQNAQSELPSKFSDTWGDLYERVRAMAD
ncbi:DctP family TRAP transporter solute-binding subunit [Microbacterium sp. NPDC055910]|uniref:DctP family TRAP transporter solute-binding subunit n=1 Tax=Microbacterium sp. NPDC055910 TaxID=3345659 RepID=UPI0035E2BBFB